MRVDLTDYAGETRYAKYASFKVDNAPAKYRLHISGFDNTGGAGDSLTGAHNNMMFSTYDSDNDVYSQSYSVR